MLRPGDIFAGRFEVLHLLSDAGAQGFVYAVIDRSTGARRALKTLPPHVLGAGHADAFRREVQASAAVPSEHVVSIVDAGVDTADQRPWVLMELLEGETLLARVARGALAPAEFAEVFGQVGEGLSAAHRQGVLHLDLKPSNVFLAASRHAGRAVTAKLVDFGIARRVEAGVTHVRVSQAVGTPEWMSPEQTGTGAVRASADVWAFGLLAFYALTGREYWRAQNDPSGQRNPMAVWEEVLVATQRGMIPASVRARELGFAAPLPPGFDAWFARAVAYDQGQRFRDATEAVPALLACFAAQPVVGDAPLAKRPSRSRTALVVVAALVLSAAGTGLTWWASSTADTPSAPDAPEAPPPITFPSAPQAPSVVRPARPLVQPGVQCPAGAVPVAGGWFGFGHGPNDRSDPAYAIPRRRTSLNPFCIDRTEVTVAAFRAFWAAGHPEPEGIVRYPFGSQDWSGHVSEPVSSDACNWTRQPSQRELHPINCVDFWTALAYCVWRGGRLPIETEWERSARGDDERTYPWGEAVPSQQLCWGGRAGTCPVGQFPGGASPFGALDMAGGVSEWVMGVFTVADRQRMFGNTSMFGTHSVMRGGAFISTAEILVRTYARMGMPRETGVPSVGMRCVYGGM